MIGVLWMMSIMMGLASATSMDSDNAAMKLFVYWPIMTAGYCILWGVVYIVCFEWWLKDVSPWFEIRGGRL